MRINLGIRRRLAPLLGNDRRKIELMNGLLFSLPGHAGPLLRRRDRHGRQHLPRRPQRRAHADAVERRPQRRLLARQPAAAVPAGDHRPRVPLRGGQRRGAAEQPELAALVDEAADRAAQAATRRSAAGTIEFLQPDEPAGARLRPPATRTRRILVVANLSRFVQFVELDLSRVQGHGAGRAVRPHARSRRSASCRTCSRSARTRSTGSSLEPPPRAEEARAARRPYVPPVLACAERREPARRRRSGDARGRAAGVPRHAALVRRARVPSGRRARSRKRSRWARCTCSSRASSTPTASRARTCCRSPSSRDGRGAWRRARRGRTVQLAAATARWSTPWRTVLRARAAGRPSPAQPRARRRRRVEATPFAALEVPEGEPLNIERRSTPRGDRALRRPLPPEDVPAARGGRQPGARDRTRPNERAPGPDARARRRHRVPPARRRAEHAGRAAGATSPSEATAWTHARDELGRFFERMSRATGRTPPPDAAPARAARCWRAPSRPAGARLIGAYLDLAALLGRRTAEMHLALARAQRRLRPSRPSRTSPLDRRSNYQSMRNLVGATLRLLRGRRSAAAAAALADAQRCVDEHGAHAEGVRAAVLHSADRPAASARTATITSSRCCTRARTSSSSTSRARRRAAGRAAPQAARLARRGGHAPLVPLRRVHRAAGAAPSCAPRTGRWPRRGRDAW